jgi:hypothetical protein
MKFIEKNWFVVLLFLLVLGGLLWFLFKKKKTVVSTTEAAKPTVSNVVAPVSAAPIGAIATQSAISTPAIATGKPIVLMFAWPSDPTSDKSLLIQCRLSDITEFSVGDYVTLPGSKLYPGKYKVWYEYLGTNPSVGSVRNLYLETKFISNEPGVTIAKA